MEGNTLSASSEYATSYCTCKRETPIAIIEKAVSCLKEKYSGPLNLAVDVGCGSGQSTTHLASFFKKVHGSDVAVDQIQEAKTNRALPNVTYEVAPAEIIPFDDGTVQLVSAGGSLHWFKFDPFFNEVRRILCNNGILLVYCYYTLKPVLEDSFMTREVDKVWDEMLSKIANHHTPQGKIAFDYYRSIDFPFEEIEKFHDLRDVFDGELKDIIEYLSEFPGFQNWKKAEEEKASKFMSQFEQRLKDIIAACNLDPNKPLKLSKEFFTIICRKVVNTA